MGGYPKSIGNLMWLTIFDGMVFTNEIIFRKKGVPHAQHLEATT
jgi:hypothetical protein